MQGMQTYKASIPAATTQIPAPMTSNAFIEEAALDVAPAVADEVAEPVAVPDCVAVEEPLAEAVPEAEETPAQSSAEMVAVSV